MHVSLYMRTGKGVHEGFIGSPLLPLLVFGVPLVERGWRGRFSLMMGGLLRKAVRTVTGEGGVQSVPPVIDRGTSGRYVSCYHIPCKIVGLS